MQVAGIESAILTQGSFYKLRIGTGKPHFKVFAFSGFLVLSYMLHFILDNVYSGGFIWTFSGSK